MDADLVVAGRHVITMNPRREIVRDGAVAIRGSAIIAVGRSAELFEAYPGAPRLHDPDAVITPGFVNAHQHLTGDRLLRSSIPDDLPATRALREWALPAHAAHTEGDDEASALASCLEQVCNGFTTVIEAGTVAHPRAVARAIESIGLRGAVGTWGWDIGDGPFTAPTVEVLARQRDNVADLRSFRRVEGWVSLVGHDLMSDALLIGASELARELKTRLTFHISPHRGDADSYLARYGRRPLVHFDALGALGSHVLLAHAVHLDDAEADAVLRTRSAIAFTPWAYLRLGQGAAAHARHAALARAGGRVALGCDSENASDALDPLRIAALCTGLAKDQREDPASFSAHESFELLTIGGAEAVGMSDRIGSLEAGKQADLVVFDTTGPQWMPRSDDPVLQLVWGCDGRAVRDVVIGGRQVVADRRITTLDADELRREVAGRAASLRARAGLPRQSKWPVV